MTQPAFSSNTAVLSALAIAISLAAGPMRAESKGPQADAVHALLDCRGIVENVKRLACFDQSAAAFGEAEEKGEVVVVGREQVQAARRQTFGFALPNFNFFGHGEAAKPLDRLESIAKEVRQGSDGRWIITLDDGARWLQIDDEPVNRSPRAGSKIDIRAAALGSFFLKIDGSRGIRARRMD